MPEYGISAAGFELKRLEDILSEKRSLATTLFQDLVQPGDFVDTSDSSALGRLINLSSVPDSTLWELAQLVYSSFDPNSATGVALDNLVQYSGIQRLGSSYSNVTGLFSGDLGTVIPIDAVVGSSTSNNSYRLTSSVTLDLNLASGLDLEVNTVSNSSLYQITYSVSETTTNTVNYTSDASATELEILNGLSSIISSAHPTLSASVEGSILRIMRADVFSRSSFIVDSKLTTTKVYSLGNLESETVGDIFDPSQSLTVIKTPYIGWDTVINPLAVSSGRNRETDEELRLRFRNTKFERSTNILDSLYSALLSIDTVESVTVYENDTNIVDSNGLPPHSFMAVVLGGESELIAETVWRNKPAGITSVGNISVEIIDSQNFPREIKFQRPTPVPIYIEIDLTTDQSFPADGADRIRSAIISYARNNFGVGDDIIQSRLYTPINSVPGHFINHLYIGTSPSPVNDDNLDIGFTDIGSFSAENIVITGL